jgi:hypothetical protein
MTKESAAPGCEVCGRRDLSLRWVEFYKVKTFLLFFLKGVESVPSLRCPTHRRTRGLLFGLRSLLLFNILQNAPTAFDNFRGGRVISGDTAALMGEFASEFARRGQLKEAEEAKAAR